MSGSAKVGFEWADGHHDFRLGIGELEELQEKTGAGPLEVLRRLYAGTWRVGEVRETLRLGLVGGGMGADAARKLVDRYAGAGQLAAAVMPATVVLNAALVGAEDEPVGKQGAAGETADPAAPMPAETSAPTDGSPSPPSTDPAS